MSIRGVIVAILAVGVHNGWASTPLRADTPPPEESATQQAATPPAQTAWQFEITPYLMAAGLNGTVGIRGVSTDIDVGFDNIWDHLDAGFMGLFTARKGLWLFGFEGIYMKLGDVPSTSVTGPFGQVTVNGAVTVTNSLSVYQASVGYRIMDTKTKVDVIGALRNTGLKADASVQITTTPPISFPGGSASANGSEDWTDAVIGAMARYPVADKVTLVGYADVGGGGSKLTYQFIAGADWQFTKTFAAKAGYRYVYWDYENGGNVWDMVASGPYLGLGISF